jgi:hypothetical protein
LRDGWLGQAQSLANFGYGEAFAQGAQDHEIINVKET